MKKLLFITSILLLSACSEQAKTPKQEVSNSVSNIEQVEITDPRVRVPPKGGNMTAAYLTIKNNGDKTLKLIGATSDISPRLELHTHEKTSDGMMSMKQVENFEIPAKTSFELAPNGPHIMIFETKNDLKAGDGVLITLKFENSPDLSIGAKLVENPMIDNHSSGTDGHQH